MDTPNTVQNPLSAYFRAPKLYTTIPSGGKFYSSDVIDMPPNGELAVFPMTSKDEIMMKNPDALLNGEAVVNMVKSCVPCVKDPRKLFVVDMDTLLVAIRGASSGDSVETSSECPECKHLQEFAVSIDAALSSQQELQDLYEIKTETGLQVTMSPLDYGASIDAGIASFQNTRSIKNISDIQDDMQRLKAFTDSFVKMADLNFELLTKTIRKVTILDSGDEITDAKHIREFVESCDNTTGKMLSEKQKEISESGIVKTLELTCENCGHEYNTEINFDPVSFFTAS